MTKIKNRLDVSEHNVWALERENQTLKETVKAFQLLETAKWIIDQERAMKRARTDSDE